jgi:two-component system NtrC family response regulator
LAKALLDRSAVEAAKAMKGFTEEAQSAIRSHPWTGNVRELENRVKRAVIMSDGPWVTPQDLELKPVGLTLREARERVERSLVEGAVRRHAGNLTQVATDLGISRPTLYDLMEKLGISR